MIKLEKLLIPIQEASHAAKERIASLVEIMQALELSRVSSVIIPRVVDRKESANGGITIYAKPGIIGGSAMETWYDLRTIYSGKPYRVRYV